MQKFGAFISVAAMCALAACGGRGAAGPSAAGGNGLMPDLAVVTDANLPKNTIGEELPSEGVGTHKDPTWGTVGGFTQTKLAQVLTFPVGSKITIRNLSHQLQHTLNVIVVGAKPPARFPANPTFKFSPSGNGQLGKGYASGAINPGSSVTVTLSKTGNYLIGCAFHYGEGMQDVIRVVAKTAAAPSPVR